MTDRFSIQAPSHLLDFLLAHLPGWSRATVKARLRAGGVLVNEKPVTHHRHELSAGDVVVVKPAVRRASGPGRSALLEILYADDDLVAINKPAGLLAVGTTGETRLHALAMLRRQLSRRANKVKLWPVHRIDRDTSGVLLFATSREVREAVMASWRDAEKIYWAIVEGRPEPASGTVDQPLRADRLIYHMHVGAHAEAKPAITHYQTERTAGGRSLLRIHLVTGRQHQIRAHMAWLGYPVVGDPRYGAPGKRMGLHALSLKILHPVSGKPLHFTTPAPADFLALLPKS